MNELCMLSAYNNFALSLNIRLNLVRVHIFAIERIRFSHPRFFFSLQFCLRSIQYLFLNVLYKHIEIQN